MKNASPFLFLEVLSLKSTSDFKMHYHLNVISNKGILSSKDFEYTRRLSAEMRIGIYCYRHLVGLYIALLLFFVSHERTQ